MVLSTNSVGLTFGAVVLTPLAIDCIQVAVDCTLMTVVLNRYYCTSGKNVPSPYICIMHPRGTSIEGEDIFVMFFFLSVIITGKCLITHFRERH